MNWKFWRRAVEKRASGGGYTDAIISRIIAETQGNAPADVMGLSALEAACSLYSRAFMAADVMPAIPALTPSVLGQMARSLLRNGESLWAVRIKDGLPMLLPAGSFDVRGTDPDEDSWQYRLDLFSPSNNTTVFLPSASVVHLRLSYESSRAWRGIPPLAWAAATGALASHLEQRLGQEASSPVGSFLPLPQDPEQSAADNREDADPDVPGPLDAIRRDIVAAKGAPVIVETSAAGFGEGRQAAPQQDWKVNRYGANFPLPNVTLRDAVSQAVLSTLGVPPALIDPSGTSQGQREAWRRFILNSALPLAQLCAEELSVKLNQQITIRMDSQYAQDIQGRSQALRQMTEAGIPLEQARKLAGLE